VSSAYFSFVMVPNVSQVSLHVKITIFAIHTAMYTIIISVHVFQIWKIVTNCSTTANKVITYFIFIL
jgi:hypothetical protein